MKSIKLPALFLLSLLLSLSNKEVLAQCPSITVNPTDVAVCAGVTSKFFVAASGTGLGYQWQEFNGSTWSNVSTAPYSGYNTDTLTIVGSPGALSGYKYRCVVSKTSCSNVTSNSATLTLQFSSFVNVSPIDTVMCFGNVASFEVDADGSGITYKWQILSSTGVWTDLTNNAPYSGVTTSKLLVSNPNLSLSGSFYRVSVGGLCPPGEVSDSAKLTINDIPRISTQPSNQSGCEGTGVTFATSATGTGLLYQWQEDQGSGFVNLPGALPYSGTYTNKLEILGTGVTAAKNGWKYRCVVTGKCEPGDTTNAVTLSVQSAPEFSSITQLNTVCAGENVDIEVIASGSGLKYQWFQNKQDGNGFNQINDDAVFSGTATSKIRISNVPYTFDQYLYYAVISGTCAPNDQSTAVTLNVKQDKTINEDPRDTAIIINKDAQFKVDVAGTGIQYHWQVDDGTGFQSINTNNPYYDGVLTNVLTVKKPKMSLSGYKYRCLVYGGCDTTPVASSNAVLLIGWPTSINKIETENNIVVYPNPVSGSILNVHAANSFDRTIEAKVTDQFGRVLLQESLKLNNGNAQINIRSLPQGVYSLFIVDEQFNIVRNIKFTKL